MNPTIYYCVDKECEKFIKGFCKVPKTGTNEHENCEIMNCSCKGCVWDYERITSKTLDPCEWIGDPYNTDHDCLAEK
jgi:hypothetical protein